MLRMLTALGLMAIVAFCVFGFLATFEYPEPSKRLPWQVAYGSVGLGCVVSALLILRRQDTKNK